MPLNQNQYRDAAETLARSVWSLLWLGVVALFAERSLPGLFGEPLLSNTGTVGTVLIIVAALAGSGIACAAWYWSRSETISTMEEWGKLWVGLLPGVLIPTLLMQFEPVLIILAAAALLALCSLVFLKPAKTRTTHTNSSPEPENEDSPITLSLYGEEGDFLDPQILLTFTRRLDDQQGEVVEGTARLIFQSGENLAVLHLPLSPPLITSPEVHCELLEDAPSVRINVTARHSYGLRIEGRRSLNLQDSLSLPVCFFISAEARSRAA